MKFGNIKSLVETKLVKSFSDETLSKDLKFFNSLLKEEKSFKELMFIYDNLSSNKGLNKESAGYLIDEFKNSANKLKLSEKFNKQFKKWTEGIVCENNYEHIDDFLSNDLTKLEKSVSAKIKIVENLIKKPSEANVNKHNLPISSLVKIANSNINKYLDNLTESEKKQVIDIIKNGESKFLSLKENTIKKIDSLIESADEKLKTNLIETKEKIESSEYSKEELTKLIKLNNGLIL